MINQSARIHATLYSDPACPWGYSENPALRVIEWRYGEQLDWRLVLVGLSEDVPPAERSSEPPLRSWIGQIGYRDRYGMPFSPGTKARRAASSRACRTVIAARREYPGSEWSVFRALQLAQFTTPLLFDDDTQMLQAISGVPGIDAERLIAAMTDAAVIDEYEADKVAARSAAGSPAEFQGKTAGRGGEVRYTAPSVVFRRVEDGLTLEAGGFQPVEAYDVLVANLDPTLTRRPVPDGVAPLLDAFPYGLSTQEVAALLCRGNDAPDRAGAEAALLTLAAEGGGERQALGDDAIWTRPGGPRVPRVDPGLHPA